MLLLLLACAPAAPDGRDAACFAASERYGTACADGTVSYGIDVSYWQGTIDWPSAAATGLDFAIMRVSHGLGTYDTQFTANWANSKAQGLVRGAYQYFDGYDSPTEQAQLLLDEMGELQPGDLPPVLDVEQTDNEGIDAGTMAAEIQEWMDVVEPAIGRKPMIYTGAYAWDVMTGDADFSDHPLWTANWTDSCPYIPDGWSRWDFWQYSDTGSIDGIDAYVDLDQFNGSASALADWAVQEDEPESCSGTCSVASDEETILEDDASCACPSGAVSDVDGHGGHAYATTADQAVGTTVDGVTWNLRFSAAGSYTVSAWVPGADGLVASPTWDVTHNGTVEHVTVDTSATDDDWVTIGTFDFGATGTQAITLGDAYSASTDAGRLVGIDALRFTLDQASCTCDEGTVQTQACSDGGTRTRECVSCVWEDWSTCVGAASVISHDDEGCDGCAANGGAAGFGFGVVAAAVAVGRRRTRRR